MRTLRNLCNHKELLNLTKTKFISISSNHSQNQHFSNCCFRSFSRRTIHSSTQLHHSENPQNGKFDYSGAEKARRRDPHKFQNSGGEEARRRDPHKFQNSGEKARRRDPHKFQSSGGEEARRRDPDKFQNSGEKARRRGADKFQSSGGEEARWRGPDKFQNFGEKARWRGPDKFQNSGEKARWREWRKSRDTALHRTRLCKDGTNCRRHDCFDAHTPEELRVVPQRSPRSTESPRSYDGLPPNFGNGASMLSSPTSILISPPSSPSSGSPPVSPSVNRPIGSNSVNEMVKSAPSRNVQIGSNGENPRVGSSSSGLSPESSVSAVNKSSEEDDEEEQSAKGKSRSWSSSYNKGNEPFRPKTENQEGVNFGLPNSFCDENGFSNENPRVWTSYDPISDQLVTRAVGDDSENQEVGSSNESPRVCLSSFDSVVGLTNSSDDENGFSNESPRFWTSYDPVSDELVTRAVGDDSENQEVGSTTESPRVRLSSFDSVVENFSLESSDSAVKKSLEEEESAKGKSRSWSSYYNKGNEPFRRKNENEEGVNFGLANSFGDENGFSTENLRVWTSFDPFSDQLVTRAVGDDSENQEVGSNNESPRVRLSSFDSVVGLTNSSDEENGFCNESPRVMASYDPVSDQLVTRAVGDDSEDQEVGSTNESPRVRLSSFDSVVESFSPESSVSAVKKSSEEDEEEEEQSAKGKSRSWSSSYKKGNEPVHRKVEDQEGVKVNSGSGSGFSSSSQSQFGLKKKGKSRMAWVCSSCGNSTSQWWGNCQSCEAVGTMIRISQTDVLEDKSCRSWLPRTGETLPQRLTDVNKGINQLTWRIPLSGLFGAEIARVLGGGLVPGCLVLVGGDPGVGKSTLLLQIAAMIAEGADIGRPAPVVYVSGEESVEQIGNRADRMRIGTEELFLYSSTDIEDILEKIQVLSPRALIVDSIQTVYLKGETGSAGGLTQVKECTSALLRFAKSTNIPVLLIGHVTKTGEIAGPRVLEHIVDVVLYMEGEKYSSHRFLRSVKNRFGSTDELGVFEMSQFGLQAVSNPSEIFLSEQHHDSEVLAGLAVAVIMDGSRTFLIEIQALCLSDLKLSRHVTGVPQSRCDMIISVLVKQAGLKLQDNVIFVNVVSGVNLTETAGDLAIATAICSSFLEFPVPNDVAFIGEIGLGGELRGVSRMEKRVNAVAKLGYKKCIVPKSAEKSLADLKLGEMMILGCKNLKEVINIVFRSN